MVLLLGRQHIAQGASIVAVRRNPALQESSAEARAEREAHEVEGEALEDLEPETGP